MSGLGNIGGTNIDALAKLAEAARKAITDALEEAARALAANPGLKSVVDQINDLLGRPKIVELSPEQLRDIIASWHSGLTAKSKPMPSDPPQPTSGFPYMELLNIHPLAHPRHELLKSGNEMFVTALPIGSALKFTVWNGVGAKPNSTWPDPGGWTSIGVI